MALRFSTALRNKIASGLSWAEALQNGQLVIYSGSQPANADTAATGTELVRFTLSGGTYTAPASVETLVTIGGTDGTITGITVGGASNSTGFNLLNATVTANASNNTDTATDVAANVNAKVNPFGITATSNGANVTLSCPKSFGTALQTLNVFAAVTANATATINGGSSSTLGGTGAANTGVAAANGLNFQPAANGAIAKESTAWQANATANGTAGWFRYLAGGSTANVTGTTELCFDGSISTSGADLNLSTLTMVSGATQTISSFTFTVPAS